MLWLGKVPQPMGVIFQVKTRFLLAALAVGAGLSGLRAADPQPDALSLLHSVRIAQAAQHITMDGNLRTGPVTVPFRLVIDAGVIRYEFKEPPLSLVLRLGEKNSQFQEVTRGGAEKVKAARYDTKVRDTDISYEDLAMRFLYWPEATIVGEESKLTRRCWKMEVKPGDTESQYSRVMLWIEQQSGALLQAEAYDKAGKLERRFSVRKFQKSDEAWILKEMRIEAPPKPGAKDITPTYLEITGVEK